VLDPLEQILAYRRLSPLLATSGQPDAEGIHAIARAGFKLLVNLALPTSPGALADEAQLASQAGLTYVHLPIDFEAPELERASELYALLQRAKDDMVFVHCAKNMRVSALLSGYRMVLGGVSCREARANLRAIWEPNHTWRRYVSNAALAAIRKPISMDTARLVLRDAQPSDAAAIHAHAGDPEVCRYLLWGPNTAEQSEDFLQRRCARQADPHCRALELLVVERSSGQVVGDATLRVTDSAVLEAELGYLLAREAWGRGLATELAEKLLEVAFGWLSLRRVSAAVDAENAASRRVLEKLGLRREAHFGQDAYVNGAYRDTLVYALTDAEYWASHAATHAD
jgi:[ribosomal protein S5]-alanine N-acetyltransferase